MNKAQIAAKVEAAFNKLGDLAYNATLTKKTQGTYNPGVLAASQTETTSTGKLLFDEARIKQADYLAGANIKPSDEVAFLQGVSFAPEKGHTIDITGIGTKDIIWANDLMRLGALFVVVLR